MKISRMISTVAASLVLTLTLSGVAYAESDGDRSVPADKGNINELIVELVEKNPGASNGRMNCSQTVWAAYKSATGIDLDSNGRHGVYPSDILNSRYTVTYQRF